MKLARLLGITMSLLTHDKISAKEFAKKYEVSTRTILRDMDELSAAGIPIVATQGNTGGFSILETFKLERNFLTVQEMEMLKSVLKGFKNSAIDEESTDILNKLNSVNQDHRYSQCNIKAEEELKTNNPIVMDFSGWADPIHLRHMVELLKKGVQDQLIMEIQYFNNNGYETKRRVHPYKIILKNSAWYLHGFCEKANDFRIFKLSRIKVIKETKDNFELKDVETPKGGELLSSSDPKVRVEEEIVLKFQKEAFSRLFDFFSRDHMEFLSSGEILVRIAYPIDEWVYFVIFSFSHQVEVLEPSSLREGVIQRIETLKAIYQS